LPVIAAGTYFPDFGQNFRVDGIEPQLRTRQFFKRRYFEGVAC
jgi:hypothetical protein